MSKKFSGVDIDAAHGGRMAETRFLTFGEIINYRENGDYPPLMDAAEFRRQICALALRVFERDKYVSSEGTDYRKMADWALSCLRGYDRKLAEHIESKCISHGD